MISDCRLQICDLRWVVISDGGLTTAEAAARLSVGKPTFRLLGVALATVGLAEPRVYSW